MRNVIFFFYDHSVFRDFIRILQNIENLFVKLRFLNTELCLSACKTLNFRDTPTHSLRGLVKINTRRRITPSFRLLQLSINTLPYTFKSNIERSNIVGLILPSPCHTDLMDPVVRPHRYVIAEVSAGERGGVLGISLLELGITK